MFRVFANNDLLISMMDSLAGEHVDLEPVQAAFEATPGDFRARFTAAIQAHLAPQAQPEVFIEIPPDPQQLRKADLEELVRPAAVGFLRSYPSKDELVDQVAAIARRQQRRPAWIPRIDSAGNPLPAGEPERDGEPDRPVVVSCLAELGDVTVLLPGAGEDRAELPMANGGIGEWEYALATVLGVVGAVGPQAAITLDAAANEALVPEQERWWSAEPPQPVSAAADAGVASELLATTATLGGLPVTEDTHAAHEAATVAVTSAGDWRYSPRWLLEAWAPGDDSATLVSARAALAGWADEGHSGVIVYVYGGMLHVTEGAAWTPTPLHSYLLTVTRPADGSDTVEAVHRLVLSCPGEHWCHRGGCPDPGLSAAEVLLTGVVTGGETVAVAAGRGGWATESYQSLYGDAWRPEDADGVLEQATGILAGNGWVELEQSTWEGGIEEILLRRGPHCLQVAYDPVTRQVQLIDGGSALDSVLDMLAEDGTLTEPDGSSMIDTSPPAVQRWGADLLAAADDLLNARIAQLPQLADPVQATVLGLHPHGDGALHTAEAITLTERQLDILLSTAGVVTPEDSRSEDPHGTHNA